MTAREITELLPIALSTVYQYAAGVLPAHRIGRTLLFIREGVEEALLAAGPHQDEHERANDELGRRRNQRVA